MCLIAFAWDAHPQYRLVMAANRDELHRRPSQDMHWWPDRPQVLAGRDLQAGGTWLAVSRSGRMATVTNYREGQQQRAGLESRGKLVSTYVDGGDAPGDFVAGIDGARFAGFNLLAGDDSGLWYVSNRGDGPAKLPAGVYGLSNAALDTPWSKLVRTRDALARLIDSDDVDETRLLQLLADRNPAPTVEPGHGDLPFELARAVTAPFIVSAEFGTRCTTVLTWTRGGTMSIVERRFDAAGAMTGESEFRFPTNEDQSRE